MSPSPPLMTHVLDVHATPLPAATITHVQALAVTVVVRLAAVAVVVAELLLLPLGSRHFGRMSFPPLGAPVLKPDLERRRVEREKIPMSTWLVQLKSFLNRTLQGNISQLNPSFCHCPSLLPACLPPVQRD